MITIKEIFICSIFFFCFLLSMASARDSTKYSTEEIRVFGNTGISSSALLPGFVQVINADQISSKNGEDLSDLLKLFAGVSVREYGGGPALSTVSMNGSGAEHTLILVDGIKLNSVQNNQFDLSLLQKHNISRMEVLSGGMSSMYGSDAIGGVINIVTKKAAPNRSSFAITGEMGSYGLRSIGINGMKSLGNINLLLSFNEESSENSFDYIYQSSDEIILKQRENSSYSKRDFSANLNADVSPSTVLSLNSNYFTSSRDLPGIETGSLPSNSYQEDALWRNTLSLISEVSRSIIITGKLGYTNDLMNYSDKLITQSYYKNISITGSADAGLSLGQVNGNAGIEFNRFTLQSNETVAGANRFQSAIYTGAEVEVYDGLRIFPSVRVDYFSDIDKTAATANFGLNYKPLSNAGLYLKARAGNNFAAPSFNELYWKTGGNSDLMPETSFNYSFGLAFESEKIWKSSVEISYSQILTSEKIIWTPQSSGFWTPENLRETRSEALILNMSANKDIGNKASLGATFSVAYTDARKTKEDFEGDRTIGKQLVYVPQFTSKAGFDFSYSNLRAGVFYDHIGTRYTNVENTKSLPPTGLLEANIQYTLPLSLFYVTGRLEANNILNDDYQMIAGYPMPLRNLTFKINLEYR